MGKYSSNQTNFLDAPPSKSKILTKGHIMSQNNAPEISSKNTKNEILEAYQELLHKVSETKQMSHQEIKKISNEQEIINKASGLATGDMIKHLTQVKLSVCQSLDALEENLSEEYRRLNEVQSAINLEEERLKELHQISVNVNSLDALIQAQKEYRLRFEQERDNARKQIELEKKETHLLWEKEQADFQQQQKEMEARVKKDHQREEEDYRYTINLERKKDQDIYNEKKTTLEKELLEKKAKLYAEFAARETILKEQEEELKTLKLKVEQFPKELEKAIKDAEKTVKEQLDTEYRYQTELSKCETDSDRKLNHQTINSLREKIKEQEELIRQLNTKANDATVQVQSIALKALEGASGFRTYSYDDGKKNMQMKSE